MGRKQGWCRPRCTGTGVRRESRSAAWVSCGRLSVDLAGSVTTSASKRSPKLLFIFKLTYKRAACPLLAPLASKTLRKWRLPVVGWMQSFFCFLFLHPIPGPFGVSVSALRGRARSAASSQALREAGGRENAAVEALGLQAGWGRGEFLGEACWLVGFPVCQVLSDRRGGGERW